MDQSKEKIRMQVGIVGAGIAGLSAAIGLAKAGHDVEIFEKSSFANEIGAAINICPNATRILSRWGFDFEAAEPFEPQGVRVFNTETNEEIAFSSYGSIESEYGYKYLLVHRAGLHAGLRALAQRYGTRITLREQPTSIDQKQGAIVLSSGKVYQKDLIVIAAGVHANFVNDILRTSATAHSSGKSAFRFLIPRTKLEGDPLTRRFLHTSKDNLNIAVASSAPNTRLIWYPCKHGELFNFTGIFTNVSEQTAGNLNSIREALVKTFEYFGEEIVKVCEIATDVRIWPLFVKTPLKRWSSGQTLVIGDASHAMMPHHGQGGAQAIEDGAALGEVFKEMSSIHEIEQRLQIFEQVRIDRVSAIQAMSAVGQDQVLRVIDEVQKFIPKVPSTYKEIFDFNFGYDVMREAARAVRSWERVKRPSERYEQV